jgi:hypothetical protein
MTAARIRPYQRRRRGPMLVVVSVLAVLAIVTLSVVLTNAAGPSGAEAEHICDMCGGTMIERHCKILCLQCGYQRDCSDP